MTSMRRLASTLLPGILAAVVALGGGCDDEDDDGGAVAGDGGPAGDGGAAGPDAPPPDPNAPRRIAEENARPGTREWALTRPATSGEIEGFADALSVPAGTAVRVMVSLDPPGAFRWKLFRMGHYGGKGGRLVAEDGPLAGETQPPPTFDETTGLVRAPWTPTFEVEVGADWVTGVYLFKLIRADEGGEAYVPLIVRDDTRDAEIAVQLSTATWQAYNDWGGESLYVTTHGMSGGKARKVSYDRPISPKLGHGAGLFPSQERPLVRWLEARGYDVEYVTNLDIGGPDGRVGAHRIVVAVGHDEYQTLDAMERFAAAVERGTSLAFLTGNTFYWQARYEDDGRTVVCYKDKPTEDPLYGVDDAHVTTAFRRSPVNRPENSLLGVMSSGAAVSTPADWVVENASHWVYEGTGLARGDRLPGVVGFEWDGLVDNGRAPAGLVVLAHTVVDRPERPHHATIYERGDAFVFAAGSIYFVRELGQAPLARLFENVLARAGARTYATP